MSKDLTTGGISHTIFELAWPTALAMALQTAFRIADGVFVGMIGYEAFAAVTVIFPIFFLMLGFASMIGIGGTSLIARCIGARLREEAVSAAGHCFALAALFGLGFVALGLVFQRDLYRLMRVEGPLMPLVVEYGTWLFLWAPFVFIAQAAGSILRAEGDMKTPLKIMAAAVVLNAVLDPLLIFGIGPFPRLELTGAALATFLARVFGCLLILNHVLKGRTTVQPRFGGFRPRARTLGNILWVGLPASVNHLIMGATGMVFISILNLFGDEAVAAYGALARLNGVAILPCLGLATAVLAIVGQCVGARLLERAEKVTWRAVLYAVVVMEGMGLVFFLTPDLWPRIFVREPEVLRYAATGLRIVSLSYMFIGTSIVVAAAFQGAGRGLPALLITLLRLVIIAVPAAYFLSLAVGVNGVWVALAVSSATAGLVSAVWFRAGTWKSPSRLSFR
jgi:putative MATE family efflux protein